MVVFMPCKTEPSSVHHRPTRQQPIRSPNTSQVKGTVDHLGLLREQPSPDLSRLKMSRMGLLLEIGNGTGYVFPISTPSVPTIPVQLVSHILVRYCKSTYTIHILTWLLIIIRTGIIKIFHFSHVTLFQLVTLEYIDQNNLKQIRVKRLSEVRNWRLRQGYDVCVPEKKNIISNDCVDNALL